MSNPVVGNNNSCVSLIGTSVHGHLNVGGNLTSNVNNIVHHNVAVRKMKPVTSFRLIQSPTSNFIGRENILSQIHRRFKECSTKEGFQERIVVIHGFGGIGKSETARKYVAKYSSRWFRSAINNVAWIDSESETSLKKSFLSLAKILKIEIPSEQDKINAEEIANEVYQHFSDYVHNGLFIFDNSLQMKNPDKYFGISKYLPTQLLERPPLILITARTSEWDIPKENIIKIQEFDQKDSIEFLIKKLNITEAQQRSDLVLKAIKKLAFVLDGYPLGLTLAASNIENEDWTILSKEIDKYLEGMEIPTEEKNWAEDTLSKGDPNNYPLIMANVWKATFDKIKSYGQFGDDAIQLLKILSYMPPDGIEMEEVKEIFEFMFKKEVSDKCFSILSKLSLISIHKELHGYDIRIHRLVQHYIRNKQQEAKDDTIVIQYCKYLSKGWCTDHSMGAFAYLENHWPANTFLIQISLLFCIGRLAKYEEELQNCLETIFEYFRVNNNRHFMLEKEVMEENEVKLMMLSLYFYQNYRMSEHSPPEFGSNIKLQDSQINKQEVNDFALKIFKCYFEHLLNSYSTVSEGNQESSKVALDHVHQMCFQMLTHKLRDPIPELFGLLVELVDLEQCGLGRKETVQVLLSVLANCAASSLYSRDGDMFWKFIFRIHNRFYPGIDQNSETEMKNDLNQNEQEQYWNGNWWWILANSMECIPGTATFQVRCKILEDYMQFLSLYFDGGKESYPLPYIFVRLMQYKYGCDDKLISCSLFMKHFHSFVVNHFSKLDITDQALCLVICMRLFSRNKVVEDSDGCD